tara:strand:+ start:214 stop:570 length:357 start_codon:yes stop_codon:yes gene_type:complete
MRKRFTDADIWDKLWFRRFSPVEKTLWKYLTDRPTFDGFIEFDNETIKHYTGFEGEIPEIMKEKLGMIKVDEHQYLLKNWIRFQYNELKENVATHKRIIERLRRKGLDQHFPELQEDF